MTQTTKEEKLIYFVARARKKEGSGKSISQILKHLAETSSTEDLQNGVADEGSPSYSSEAVVGKDYAGRDLASIVKFCKYVMGIYDFQLMKDKLGKLGCIVRRLRLCTDT